jgi:hypothetical protein
LAAPSIPAQFTFRNINRLARDSDQWFESISLQRRVSCEPDFLSRVDHAGEVLDVLRVQLRGGERERPGPSRGGFCG